MIPVGSRRGCLPPAPCYTLGVTEPSRLDRAAFEKLVLPHREALVRFITLMTGPDAEDIAQEAITRAFDTRHKFEKRSKVSTWLFGIALNICRTTLRNRGRHAAIVEPEKLGGIAGRRHGVLTSLVRHEMADRMQAAILALPPDLKEAFILRYVDGMEYEEMAEITGVAPGTLRVRSHRARNQLKDSLGSAVDTIWKV